MSHKAPKSYGAAVTLLVIVPLLYVLSIGPVTFVIEKYFPGRRPRLQNVIRTIYAPLIWLMENPSIRQPLVDYGKWWSNLAQPPAPSFQPDPFAPAPQ